MGKGQPPKQVICVDTGVIYESIAECKKETGVNWYNIRHATPYKGMVYQYYNRCENPEYEENSPEEREISEELYFQHFFKAFQNKHPEYNKITKTMTAKEYADYLRERKDLK